MIRIWSGLPLVMLLACGPAARNNGNGSGSPDGGSDSADSGPCVPTAEVCNDGIDNDCDGKADCVDPDCSGVGTCPVCGNVNDPEATPIALPDGISSGAQCSTDTQCGSATPNCIIANGGAIKECHASYTSTLNFIGFGSGATLTDTTKLLNVCVSIEHSYLHDLQWELRSPPDATGYRHSAVIHEFVGRVGPEIFVGIPNENDETGPVIPGTAWTYCLDPMATATMYNSNLPVDSASQSGGALQVPMGNYLPMHPFSTLQGAPLNGAWEIRITDMYAVDNGTLKGWSIKFDPSLVSDCSGPIIQ